MDEKIIPVSKTHIEELDYLKCIMIVLMVAFHLVYIEKLYPFAKDIVYTFHMPVFLIISGYLTNINKSTEQFLRNVFWIFIPYVIMESGYIIMSSVLPIRDHIDNLSIALFIDKLLLHPLGPYWYLHTLILCMLTYYFVFKLKQIKIITRCILLGIIFSVY